MRFSLFLLLMISFMLGACQKRWKPTIYKQETPGFSDPDKMSEEQLIGRVQSVAILNFIDMSDGRDNTLNRKDLQDIADSFANHLTGAKTFGAKVMYPRAVEKALAGTEFSSVLYSQATEEELLENCKEIANLLDVDAIVFGIINQYKMYYPPDLSISMKFYLAKLGRFASAEEVSAQAHYGIPLPSYSPTFFRQLWNERAYYDSTNKIFERKLKRYYKTHQYKVAGFDKDLVLRSKREFLKFIAFDLAASLDSLKTGGESHTRPREADSDPKLKRDIDHPKNREHYFSK